MKNLFKLVTAFLANALKIFAGYKVNKKAFYGVATRLGEALLIAGVIGLIVVGDSVNVLEAFALFGTGFVLVLIGLRRKDE